MFENGQQNREAAFITGHVLQLGRRERRSIRNSLIPTSRFTSSPRALPRTSNLEPILATVPFGNPDALGILEGRRSEVPRPPSSKSSSNYSAYEKLKQPGQITSTNREQPKAVIKRGFFANWALIAPHIIAIFVTAAVCQLSFRNVFWMDLLPPNIKIAPGLTQAGALNFLQLAAKVHELTILGSISTIVLHVFQASFAGSSGIPLGLMANAFELGSGSFLRHRSFWANMWARKSPHQSRFRFTPVWALSLFATILVMLAGPSSAIAIIPTLNYFPLSSPFNTTTPPLYIFNHSTELWPAALTSASLNGPTSNNNCTEVAKDSLAQDICPAGGFRQTYSWAGTLIIANGGKERNISFQDETSNTRRIVMVQDCERGMSGRASGTGINAFLHRALTTYWVFARQNFHGPALEASQPQITLDNSITKLFAPRVEVICNGYDNHAFSSSNPQAQKTMYFPAFSSKNASQFQFPVPDWAYKYSRPLNASNFTFVQDNLQPMPFLGAVLINPILEKVNGTYRQSTENLACSIYSSWIPITATFDPTVSDQISYSIRSPLTDTCLSIPSPQSPSSPFTTNHQQINTTISLSFANAINQKIFFTDSTKPAVKAIFERYIFNNSPVIQPSLYFLTPVNETVLREYTNEEARTRRARLISTVLAGVVTDSLARNAGNGVFPYTSPILLLPNRTATGELKGRYLFSSQAGGRDLSLNTTDINQSEKWLRVELKWRRFGYGYTWGGNRTAQFGVCVLLLHALVAVVHVGVVGWMICSGRGVVRAWETVEELFVLALRSRGFEGGRLEGTCAGIGEKGTWREVVGVREVGQGLEVVVGEEELRSGERQRVRAGVNYGDDGGGEGGYT